MNGLEIDAIADRVLRFWLEETPPERRWGKDAAFDAEIGLRFGSLRDRVLETGAEGWDSSPHALLAAIILLDQFSRNLHRGKAEAFAGDALALALARTAIQRDWDARYSEAEREFLYMPLEHAEDHAMQALSEQKFATLSDPEPIRYAREHADVIRRFGRFPSRNAALGRASTPEEEGYLRDSDPGW